MKLDNKVALVTGGNSGIGLAAAREFMAEGARVAICGRDRAKLDAAQGRLGEDVLAVQADISKPDDLERLFEAVTEHFGKIDVLFANAGDVKFMPLPLIDEDLFDYVTNNCFRGTFFTLQKSLPFMNDGASIILMSATGQSMGFPGSTLAAANKAAIRSLARGASADLLPSRGIRVNCLSPGPIDTPLFDSLGLPSEQVAVMKKGFEQLIPFGRMGTPEEVAKVALFLASNDSSFVVGEEIKVGGGEGNFRV